MKKLSQNDRWHIAQILLEERGRRQKNPKNRARERRWAAIVARWLKNPDPESPMAEELAELTATHAEWATEAKSTRLTMISLDWYRRAAYLKTYIDHLRAQAPAEGVGEQKRLF